MSLKDIIEQAQAKAAQAIQVAKDLAEKGKLIADETAQRARAVADAARGKSDKP